MFCICKATRSKSSGYSKNLSQTISGEFDVSANGGYLNFKARSNWLAENVMDIETSPGNRNVLIEHTSANPNGPFHVGRARNAILGDTLVRLNRLFGNDVRAEYYVDDMGKQVGVLAWALQNLSKQEVDAILDDEDSINPKWSGKKTMKQLGGTKPLKVYVLRMAQTTSNKRSMACSCI